MRLRNLAVGVAACVMLANCTQQNEGAAPSGDTIASHSVAPANVGDCVETTVSLTGPRLEGVADSGSTIQYANGMMQVDYSVVPAIANSQVGDSVRVCLVSVPENCPPGDNRGRVYSATNARTGETWTAPDSQHSCGGA